MSQRGDVATFDEVIDVFAEHHECSNPKDKVYGFRELISQQKGSLEVNYNQPDLQVFLDIAKLDLLELTKHGGSHAASRLWSAMGLGDREKLNDFLQKYLV